MSDPTSSPGPEPVDRTVMGLAQRLWGHQQALLDHRYGLGDPLTAAQLAAHTLAALSIGRELADTVTSARWVLAADALSAGATRERVAEAMGLDADELHYGLRTWARTQLQHGFMTDARHGEVLALLGEQPPGVHPMDLPTWQLRRMVILIEALGDPPLTLAERATLAVLARHDQATVDNLAAVLRRVRGADR